MPGVQAVLFDFVGVFMASPFAAVRAYGASQGLEPERALAILFGVHDRDTDHPWHRFERGELSLVRRARGDLRARGARAARIAAEGGVR